MAETEIQWASHVWNFVRGCRRVSLGCGGAKGQGGCYAEKQAYRFSGPGQPYEGLVTLGANGPRWTGKGRFVAEKLSDPLKVRPPKDGSRHRFFVNSMSDLFFEEFSNEQIAAGFGVMAACPQHDFLILTKRPERALEWLDWIKSSPASLGGVVNAARGVRWYAWNWLDAVRVHDPSQPWIWPLPNVWLGASAENQPTYDERRQHIDACPAAVHWWSLEPLLGPIDLRLGNGLPNPDWVVCGGESGPGARPCALEWIESIVEQCRAHNIPCFVKQLGAFIVSESRACDTDEEAKREFGFGSRGTPEEWPEELNVRQFPEAVSF